jgi:hypothetical protein
MGTVEWFLGTHFQWSKTEDVVLVHLSQTGFVAHLVKDNSAHLRSVTPDATLYHSGLPIDAIPESDEDENCPMLWTKNKNIKVRWALLGG